MNSNDDDEVNFVDAAANMQAPHQKVVFIDASTPEKKQHLKRPEKAIGRRLLSTAAA